MEKIVYQFVEIATFGKVAGKNIGVGIKAAVDNTITQSTINWTIEGAPTNGAQFRNFLLQHGAEFTWDDEISIGNLDRGFPLNGDNFKSAESATEGALAALNRALSTMTNVAFEPRIPTDILEMSKSHHPQLFNKLDEMMAGLSA